MLFIGFSDFREVSSRVSGTGAIVRSVRPLGTRWHGNDTDFTGNFRTQRSLFKELTPNGGNENPSRLNCTRENDLTFVLNVLKQ